MKSNPASRVRALKELFVHGPFARRQYAQEEVEAILDWAARAADEGGEQVIAEEWLAAPTCREERHFATLKHGG